MIRAPRSALVVATMAAVACLGAWPRAQQSGATARDAQFVAGMTVLLPTPHAPMPRDLSLLWLAPERSQNRSASMNAIASASKLLAGGDFAKALSTSTQSGVASGPLALYAQYYAAVSQLRLDRAGEALKTFQQLQQRSPVGYLAEAAVLGEADARMALNQPGEAIAVYERLLKGKPSSLEDVLMRLGRAQKASGDRERAAETFARVYYEFALGDLATAAGAELAFLNVKQATPGSPRFKLELGRAERLFGARQYGLARDAFDDLKSLASGDDRELIQLRLAESDYFLKRYRAARDALKPLTEGRLARQAEALYFYAVSSRDTGDPATYLRVVDRILSDFPDDSWAEEALDSLGTFYIRRDEDEKADEAFRRLYERFPTGASAERAAWKAGWRAYRQGQYADTVQFFERAASDFPRSDYRPTWLYWAGRANERLGNAAAAKERYSLVVADYLNSYYGRLAVARLGGVPAGIRRVALVSPNDQVDGEVSLPAPPPNAAAVRALLGAEMFDDALNELRYARRVWGDSPAIEATVAWTNQQKARAEKGMTRFQLMRGGVNTMRRAYPQFMAIGGEDLPRDVLTVIYPLQYWDLIQRYAGANGLDPFLVAALTLQESTFVADIRSHANAYGLMQLLPSTARQYARKLQIPYSSRLLTDPEANIRMGTAYLADKIKEFGSPHLALASYNAGEGAVHQWMTERPGIERDEFIDDIPYPETQGYVRKILGTAEDYRRIYSNQPPVPAVSTVPAAATKVAPAPAKPSTTAKKPTTAAPAKPKPRPSPTPAPSKRSKPSPRR